jgi:hypothetical protein
MADDNTTLDGFEFDRDDLETALEQLPNTTDGIAQSGNVFIAADGYTTDDDIRVAYADEVITPKGGHDFEAEQYVFVNPEMIRDAIKESEESDIVAYVEDAVFNANEVYQSDDTDSTVHIEHNEEEGSPMFTSHELNNLEMVDSDTLRVDVRVDESEL